MITGRKEDKLNQAYENLVLGKEPVDEEISASAQYATRVKEINKIMASISKKIKAHAQRQKKDPDNWGMSGDLGRLLEDLKNIDNYMS